MKFTDSNVTSASIRQNIRNILSNTCKANIWALDKKGTLNKHLNIVVTSATTTKHKWAKSEGIIYSCDACHYSRIPNSNLKGN